MVWNSKENFIPIWNAWGSDILLFPLLTHVLMG